MRNVRSWFGTLILLGLAFGPDARPLSRDEVPAPLEPWVDWVLHGYEAQACPPAHDDPGARTCAWPGALGLELDDRGGRFELHARVFARAWLALPGDERHWPQEVTVENAAATVSARDGRPAIELPPGEYRVSGRFLWGRLPETLATPPEVGLVRLSVNGRPIDAPDVSAAGELWLKRQDDGAADTEADAISIQVYRRIVDELPMRITTRVDLQVAGRNREVVLAPVLLEGFLPLELDSALPAEIQTDGSLRLQIRPGRWAVQLTARAPAEQTRLALPKTETPWPAEEVWVFDARTALRLVEVAGAPSVDPRQTALPVEWQRLPAYLLRAGGALALQVIRRGDPEPAPDQLRLERDMRLDFDGGGYTIADRMHGAMSRGWRLEARPELAVGRVTLDGEPQLVTTRTGSERRGVEVRRGALALEADGRYEGGRGRFAAIGWDHDVQQLGATLHLPPGWRLFGVGGVDHADNTWIDRWTLLDLFLVLIVTLAVGRLWQWRRGALALAALVLIWHEPGAPRQIWLHLLAAIALVRVLPAGRLHAIAGWYRNGALLVLIAILVPFAANTLRTALYPQLGPGDGVPSLSMRNDTLPAAEPAAGALPATEIDAGAVDSVVGTAADQAPVPLTAAAPAGLAATRESLKARVNEAGVSVMKRAGGSASTYNAQTQRVIDPSANVQTGPGVPTWQWARVRLNWNGPVERDQELRLWLLSPVVNRVLAFAAVGLAFALVAMTIGSVRAERRRAAATLPVLWALAVAGPLLFGHSDPARAEFPAPELLNDLRARLLEPPTCLPACAEIARARLELSDEALSLRLDVLAAEAVAVPIPGAAGQWLPSDVSIDGDIADDRLQRRGTQLWLAIPKGAHQVLLLGPVPARASFDLPLPLTPHRLDAEVRGWTLDGVRADARPEAQLRLSRDASGRGETPSRVDAAGTPQPLPPFVRVERTLELGLDWQVHTRVVRLSPPGVAVVIAVPLLAGESVTTADVQVIDGEVQVNMAPDASDWAWSSALAKTDSMALTAPATNAWTEIWRANVAPIWHVDSSGLAVVQHQDPAGQWLPQWQPWPGESVTLTISRPQGVSGPTLTIDTVNLDVTPGKRATDVELGLAVRSSQGGQHTITLPDEVSLQAVTIDGMVQPIRQEGRAVTLPVRPGLQQVDLTWRSAQGVATWLRSPQIDLSSPSVNLNLQMNLSADRWVLVTGGPRLGPAVLFWSVLIVTAVIALALSRVPGVPLDATAWLLLGIGLTQVDVWAAMLVIGWLLALAVRARVTHATPNVAFNTAQIALPLLTLAAFAVLFEAIRRGLLGTPDMQIGGNGSDPYHLRWYQDRSAAVLPSAFVFSVPLLVYRAFMLAWSLWLALALLRWLRWGWQCYSTAGLWRPWRRAAIAAATQGSGPAS